MAKVNLSSYHLYHNCDGDGDSEVDCDDVVIWQQTLAIFAEAKAIVLNKKQAELAQLIGGKAAKVILVLRRPVLRNPILGSPIFQKPSIKKPCLWRPVCEAKFVKPSLWRPVLKPCLWWEYIDHLCILGVPSFLPPPKKTESQTLGEFLGGGKKDETACISEDKTDAWFFKLFLCWLQIKVIRGFSFSR